ncbi:hypothetical protein EDB82DRAFT_45123 [Fusarium venenatum]|uniref:uncharacterized protein n=1 Tax=Fusarium venenatum TaxID=56646 RepID=UPI001D865643|nr:hypothetical protein EDB82DRAFT_45123 [Fusarium venenatum]
MIKTNLVLFAVAGMAVAGPCKPGSSTAQTTGVSASYSSSVPSIATLTFSTTGASTTDTTNEEETEMIYSTQVGSETTTDTTFFSTETATFESTGNSVTDFFSDTTLATIVTLLGASETTLEVAATTTAATDEPYECVGSIRIQEDHYIGIRGGYQGKLVFSECAQLCEDSSSCYAFAHNSADSCWTAATASDIASESEALGWQSGIKGTCHRAK